MDASAARIAVHRMHREGVADIPDALFANVSDRRFSVVRVRALSRKSGLCDAKRGRRRKLFSGAFAHPRRPVVGIATHACDRTVEPVRTPMRFRKPLKKSSLRIACRRVGRSVNFVVVVRRVAWNGGGDDAIPTCLKKK
ncbi:hypothetical protein [Lysobacter auxotrophicus]|uniref:Uncharacterized protein n=1 Tax=Lysobacter auxotrophicus TaxID=2992573 RepID=A0ABM8DGP3_9GAMM|nr:hypothetical protein [Lysobacter auxotrophicus]BDU17768.1 hypothetical protein LA521A_29690 [Lysobacter auxotrophicus]